MYLSKAAIFLAIIPFTLATDCMVSDSSPWPFGDSSGGGSVTDECAQYDKDSAEYQACEDIALKGQCNSVGGSACEDPSDSDGGNSGGSGLIRRLETRATLSCTSDETCYQYTNSSLVCFDLTTSKYHDDAGGKGNLLEGTYTAPDEDNGGTTSTASGSGRSTTTDSNDSTPTRTGASGGSSTSSTAGAFSDAAATTGTATRASATPTSGGEVLRAHALVGALGLGAALVL